MPVPSPFILPRKPNRNFRLWRPKRSVGRKWIAGLLVLWLIVGYWKASTASATAPLPAHAKYGFVLDGQSPDGLRVGAGLDLLRKGTIDTLIVSGVEVGGGIYFSMLWVRNLPLTSKDKERVVEMRSNCTSTMNEARMMDEFFRQRKLDTAVVITSNFHVWRSASIFEKVSLGRMHWFFQPAPDTRWDGPWTDREMLKSHLMEWSKRLSWVLVEQWKPLDRTAPVNTHSLHGGEDLGRLPPPAWK